MVVRPDFQLHDQRAGRLITGQHPAFSESVARLLLEALAIRYYCAVVTSGDFAEGATLARVEERA
jgi:hypothetical protein